jgi:hypothetical protein
MPESIRDINKIPELQITSQAMDYNVTLKRVRLTIFAFERQYVLTLSLLMSYIYMQLL